MKVKAKVWTVLITSVLLGTSLIFFNARKTRDRQDRKKYDFNFNRLLRPIRRVSPQIIKRLNQVYPNKKKYFYQYRLPRRIMSLNPFIQMNGRLLGKNIRVVRKYAKPYKDNSGFFYRAEISNKESNKPIGNVSISATTGAITGDLKINGKNYKINSFENRIISLSEVEESNFICDTASVPQKGRKDDK